MISSLRHPNLVKILGCCSEGDQLLLVYEYMENNSLYHVLLGKNIILLFFTHIILIDQLNWNDDSCLLKLGSERTNFKLDWLTRCNIVLGIAKGLAYLHEESRIKIVHRDIKSTNVLLDKDFNAKISDFGLAKLYDDRNSHITTRIAGTRLVNPHYQPLYIAYILHKYKSTKTLFWFEFLGVTWLQNMQCGVIWQTKLMSTALGLYCLRLSVENITSLIYLTRNTYISLIGYVYYIS